MNALEVHNLRKEFIRRDGGSRKRGRRRRVAALQGLSFTMQRGECLAILGQNGSVKSTLVRLLSTLVAMLLVRMFTGLPVGPSGNRTVEGT